jgi:hypothetical protein
MPRSVAPSGIPEPTTDPDGPAIVVPAPDPAPEPPTFEEAQLVDMPDPPPSKAALELALGHGMTSGLTPGVFISVAPSGMPPRPEEFDEELFADGMPIGEVGPIPGVAFICACAATTPIHQPTVINKSKYRIERPQLVIGAMLSGSRKA